MVGIKRRQFRSGQKLFGTLKSKPLLLCFFIKLRLRVEMVAPRIVAADLLSEEIMATVKHNTKALGKLRNLGARLSEQPILAALGGHVLILARKT